jgi:hypothetical protein
MFDCPTIQLKTTMRFGTKPVNFYSKYKPSLWNTIRTERYVMFGFIYPMLPEIQYISARVEPGAHTHLLHFTISLHALANL